MTGQLRTHSVTMTRVREGDSSARSRRAEGRGVRGCVVGAHVGRPLTNWVKAADEGLLAWGNHSTTASQG